MVTRKNTFLLKRSNVAGNVPAAGQILLGELALNTADVKLYASGTTTNSILPIGWDRVSRTGDTMTGMLVAPTLSATTYKNLPPDVYVTGGTYNNGTGTATFINNTGGTFNVTGFTTGYTLTSGSITSALEYTPLPTTVGTATGTTLSFITDKVYGTIASPITGNITADVTGGQLGVTNIVIHNSATGPSFSSEYKRLTGSSNYLINNINYIFCTYISSTEIIYSINQRT